MLALIGERTKQRFTIGDVVKVKIVRTNIENRQIDMELVD
jgi:DNA-directed RNA polymerase subunit E'/Rpb7